MKVKRRSDPTVTEPRRGPRTEPGSHRPKMRTNAPTKPALYDHDGNVVDTTPKPKKRRVDSTMPPGQTDAPE